MMIALGSEFEALVPQAAADLESLLEGLLGLEFVFLDAGIFQIDLSHFQTEVALLL